MSLNPVHDKVYSIQHYVIKFVSDLGHVSGFLQELWFPPPIKLTATIYTHYIHSVVVQDFVSGRVCCVNQRVVMRLVHATDKTWYTVLYHHTMYVISLSNISIKTNFKQIARVELKCVQYSWGRLYFVYDVTLFFPFIHQRYITVFCFPFQWYDVMSK